MSRLVIATQNAGKAKELRKLLPGVEVQTLADHDHIAMPPEDGETFEDNALDKARHVMERLNVAVIADDSGLCVDALDGRPGVRSARYAEGSDRDRIDKLLFEMAGKTDRSARFVCAMAFRAPEVEPRVVRGTLEGEIMLAPKGDGGFGYDPVFRPLSEPTRTLAELSMDDKGAISHRGSAVRALMPDLVDHFSLESKGGSP